jgi:hypothetical protein
MRMTRPHDPDNEFVMLVQISSGFFLSYFIFFLLTLGYLGIEFYNSFFFFASILFL